MTDRQPPPLRLGEAHQSLAELVCADVRNRILSGALQPGQRLVEENLASQLGVSRNPVREAIRMLAAEGFVDLTARRGATVARLRADQTEDLFHVRAALEGLAARVAASRHTPADIEKLERILDDARADEAAGQLDDLAELNTAFHLAIADVAGRTYVDVSTPVLQRAQWLFRRTAASRASSSHLEHRTIVEAIAAGAEDYAEAAARAHVEAARQTFIKSVD